MTKLRVLVLCFLRITLICFGLPLCVNSTEVNLGYQSTAGDLPVLFRLFFFSSYQIQFAQKEIKNLMILFKDFSF
jgi:hypothetical protein